MYIQAFGLYICNNHMKISESKFCQCIYFTTNALARKIEKLALKSWKPVNLSPSHAYLILMVLQEPGTQPGCIANHLQLSPSTVTRLIEKLEEKGLATRITEGKTTKIFPTAAAKQLLPALLECSNQFYNSCNNILGRDESNELICNMTKIADKLEM